MRNEASGSAEESRDLLVFWLQLGVASILLFSGVYALLGLWRAAAFEIGWFFVVLAFLLVVRSGRGRLDILVLTITAIVMAIVAQNTILLGGIVPSGGFIVWAILAPVAALVFLDGWMRVLEWAATVAFLATFAVLDPFLEPFDRIPPMLVGPFFVLNVVTTASVILAALRHFRVRASRAEELRRQLEEEVLTTRKMESLGTLSGGIAHDFNNILMAASGHVSLARLERMQPEAVDEHLGEAERALARAAGLTQQLLLFSRGGTPVREVTSIADTIRESAGFIVHGTRARLRLEIPDDLPPIEADVGQISRLIQNLVMNAVQAMPEGGTVSVRCEAGLLAFPVPGLEVGRRYVKIRVSDEGTGIPESIRSRIFDPYFSTRDHGAGLGLATCHAITRRHDGAIRVDSVEGQGSTFTVYLPASDRRPEPVASSGEHPSVRPGAVLVMDDEPGVRNVVARMLKSLGWEAETVADGAEAVERYRATRSNGRRFDAVVLDLTVPGGLGGADTLKRLIELDPDVRAIAASGYTDDPVLAEHRDFGFRAALRKPFRVEDLGRALVAATTKGDTPAA